MPELAFRRHGQEVLRVALGVVTRIGRGADCDIVLPDPEISRLHAIVERRPDGYYLLDRSGRGLPLGSETAPELRLANGTVTTMGGLELVFRTESPAPATTLVSGETTVREAESGTKKLPVRLRVRADGQERVIRLRSSSFAIGKAPANDLVLDDAFVSSRHARLDRDAAGRWYVTDLASRNGTFVAGSRILQGEILPGTSLTMGSAELTLELDEADAQGPEEFPGFEGMVSADPGMRRVFELIERVAAADAVMVLGETGTGKELVARALHLRSPRRDGPFVAVNCAAIAPTLIENELFGHAKGAFTGALQEERGLFGAADGGTLFLDEIGELPLEVQAKLLRALDSGEVRPVGSAVVRHVSLGVVAATHRDLDAQVAAGKFREDLYYRLSVMPLHLPPLRSRRGDVALLARWFLAAGAPPASKPRWSDEALAKLATYHWPGNVRQLRNAVQRALLLRDEDPVLGAELVLLEGSGIAPPRASGEDVVYVRGLTLEAVEREVLRLALRRHGGKRSAIMKELDISRPTLLRKISQWSLEAEGQQDADDGDEPGGDA